MSGGARQTRGERSGQAIMAADGYTDQHRGDGTTMATRKTAQANEGRWTATQLTAQEMDALSGSDPLGDFQQTSQMAASHL